MEEWAGFTDADLKKLKHTGAKSDGTGISPRLQAKKPGPSSLVVQRRPNSGQKRQVPRQPASSPEHVLPPEQRLSQPKPVGNKEEKQDRPPTKPVPPTNTQTDTSKANSTPSTDTGSHHQSKEDSADKGPEETTDAPADEDASLITDDQEIFKHEASTMVSFQKQQKMIQEQNKRQKQMLQTKIKERSKAAKAESAKLTEIGRELGKLDQLLTVDVSIIRDRIETASREYYDAQKRYDRAEKEYVASKIDLHQKMESKEQLTEHLYTVIYQNEMRKAKKLAELMVQLEMEAGEVSEIPECEMPHPSLLSPVQLPAGRYGQIGLIYTKTLATSPEAVSGSGEDLLKTPTVAGVDEGKKEEVSAPEKSEDSLSADKAEEQQTGDKSDRLKGDAAVKSSENDTKSESITVSRTEGNEIAAEKSAENNTELESTTVYTDKSEKVPKDINQNSAGNTEISSGDT